MTTTSHVFPLTFNNLEILGFMWPRSLVLGLFLNLYLTRPFSQPMGHSFGQSVIFQSYLRLLKNP